VLCVHRVFHPRLDPAGAERGGACRGALDRLVGKWAVTIANVDLHIGVEAHAGLLAAQCDP